MADEVLINIRTVGVETIKEAAQQIVEMGRVSEGLTGKLGLANRAIIRQVQAEKQLTATKKMLMSAVKQGIISQGQMNTAMKEAHRVAREFVATDKDAIRVAKERKKKIDEEKASLRAIRMEFDANFRVQEEVRRQEQAYQRLLQEGIITQTQYQQSVAKMRMEASQFYKGVADGGNQFARFNVAQYKAAQNLKRQFSTNLQQAGYQVGDFIVQVQSGQSVLVALGQQGSQLAGVFGAQGAIVGAFLAAGTALGLLIQKTYEAKNNIKTLDEALADLGKAVDDLERSRDAMESVLVKPVVKASKALEEYFKNLQKLKSEALRESLDAASKNLPQLQLREGASPGMPLMADAEDMKVFEESAAKARERTESYNNAVTKSKQLFKDFGNMLVAQGPEKAIPLYTELFNLVSNRGEDVFKEYAKTLKKIGDETGVERAIDETRMALVKALETPQETFERINKQRLYMSRAYGSEAIKQAQAEAQARLNSESEVDKLRKRLQEEAIQRAKQLEEQREAARKKRFNEYFKNEAERQAEEKAAKNNIKILEREQLLQIATNKALEDGVITESEKALIRQKEANLLTEQLKLKYEDSKLSEKTINQLIAAELISKGLKDEEADRLEINNKNADAYERQYQAMTKMYKATQWIKAEEKLMSQAVKPIAAPPRKLSYKYGKSLGMSDEQLAGLGVFPPMGGGGKSAAEKFAEDRKGISDEANRLEKLLGLFDEQRTIEEEILKLKDEYGVIVDATAEKELRANLQRIEGYKKAQEELEKQREKQKQIADTIAGSMGDAFMSIVDGTKSVKDAFKDMARYIIKRLFEILVIERMVKSISGAISSGFGGGTSVSPSANGNVFNRGSLVPFANGGVVGSPTYFPMSGGKTGLMGEAGPEAIMPLKRGKGGKLGVSVEGQGGVTINQTFAFQANGDDSVKKIIAQAAPKIAAMTQQQIMDSRRRGGQMKQVFG